jgi:hypothetical protein
MDGMNIFTVREKEKRSYPIEIPPHTYSNVCSPAEE